MNPRIKHSLLGLAGPLRAWYMVARETRDWTDLSARLRDTLARISPEIQSSDESPVFILCAGWRSGSTLLQRMVMEHNSDLVIWGEPFAHSDIWRGMANQFRAFTADWPREDWFLSARTGLDLANVWVANLYPDVARLLDAHRRFYDAVFGEQSRSFGRKTWGVKEVRLTIDDATYLRVLYPKCKLIFLYRNPRDAYLSYRKLGAAWYRRWPDKPIATAYSFGRNWAEITHGFIFGYKDVNGLLVRYEDLDIPAEVKRIEGYLGWPVPRSSEMKSIGKSRLLQIQELSRVQRVLLNFGVGGTFKDAGYG
ncbi:MAG TPA: sulfotransferase [Steroidobacteraceae bacterium]|jgi:hypothetical protein